MACWHCGKDADGHLTGECAMRETRYNHPRINHNSELLSDFMNYCVKHPEERFWQALRNWSGWSHILVGESDVFNDGEYKVQDTFFWKGKGK